MKQQEVFKKVGTILKELSDQYEYLKETEADLNDLELELFVANTHFLADHSEVLRKLNLQNNAQQAVPQEPAKKSDEKFFEPVVQQLKPIVQEGPKPEPEPAPEPEAKPVKDNEVEDKPVPHIDLAANGADDDFSVMRRDEPVIRHELELDEADLVEDEDEAGFDLEEKPKEVPPVKYHAPAKEEPAPELKKETAHTEHKKEPKHEEHHTKEAVEEPMTINQRMSAQLHKTHSYSEQAHAQPIADLKQAISLNDKLLYIKDLFNGYNLAYSEAIDILNRFSSFKEAEDFLRTNYAVKNQWDTKQATADKFYTLLSRRYS